MARFEVGAATSVVGGSGHSPGDSPAATRFGSFRAAARLSIRDTVESGRLVNAATPAVAIDRGLDLSRPAVCGPPRDTPIAKFLNFWRVQVGFDP